MVFYFGEKKNDRNKSVKTEHMHTHIQPHSHTNREKIVEQKQNNLIKKTASIKNLTNKFEERKKNLKQNQKKTNKNHKRKQHGKSDKNAYQCA